MPSNDFEQALNKLQDEFKISLVEIGIDQNTLVTSEPPHFIKWNNDKTKEGADHLPIQFHKLVYEAPENSSEHNSQQSKTRLKRIQALS